MPTVPRRNQSFVPRTRSPALQPGNVFQPPEPVNVGPAVQQIAQIIERHSQRADDLAVLEADNKLGGVSTDLETQTLQKHGKDALEAGPQVEESWKQSVSEIEAGLTNDWQRDNFRARVGRRWESLNATVQRHGSQEFQKYDAEQTDVGLNTRVESAVTNYADPKQVQQAVSESKALVQLYGSRNRMSPEQITDKQLTATTRLHAQVISRMLAEGKDILANDYYKKVKGEIGSETGTQLEQRLEVASSEGEGLRGATDIWTRLGPQSLNDPVKIATMEQEARDKYGNDPKVLKATIQELRSRAQAQNAEQTEVTAGQKATVLGAFAKGASVASLTRSPAYLSLSGTEQEQLKSYMLNSQYNAANRELILDAKDDSARARRGFARYWEISDPTKLASMSENQILALEPTLGRTLVGNLMTQKRSLVKKDGTLPASIDDDLFRTIADDAGLKPYEPKLDETAKRDLGRLKVTAENEIDRAQQAKGKPLTRDEKSAIMHGVVDQHVMLDVFGRDDQVIASTVTRDQRGKAYIPLERVPPTIRLEALNWMRSNGLILSSETDKSALARFQRRIEKAYAARVIGASAAEIDQILRGTQ